MAIPFTWHDLQFQMFKQEQWNWCWAAVAKSVAGYFEPGKKPLEQCDIATAVLSDPWKTMSCCTHPDPCDMPYYLASPIAWIGHLRDWDVGRTAEFHALTHEIGQGLPVAIRIAYRSGGAHFVVVSGYLVPKVPVLDDHLCIVDDPLIGRSLVPYHDLRHDYQQADWTDTYHLAK